MYNKIRFLAIIFLMSHYSFSQEGIPVYSDYLSDNYYLIHPSMAGAANCAKIRLTGRKQWFDQKDAPELQTLSFNGKVGEKAGAGFILFNDKNGYHSQKGIKLTYAYHLMFSRDEIDLNQLSFGISGGLIQSQLDETAFLQSGDFDPIIDGTVVQKDSYFNVDFGISYNFLDFYAHATVKNAIETRRNIYTEYESDNLRKFLFSAGYVFGNSDQILWEPSVLFQLVDQTKEKSIDLNLKAYKNLDFGRVWGGLSYRRSFDGAEYLDGNTISKQKLQYITPIVGVNFDQFMVAYTYSQLSGAVKFDNGGYHQITLGIDLFCKPVKYDCNCPAIN
ncbi:type IX secretion system membrane protein PorP/SprF [Flavobacterium sp. LS1P28]|uniref:Type IX secretion system membrane protein PorP/SprF n=1 Tax=Flavobacterium bomense TaxID=2497483 RepID=A0A3S0NZD2_9FLAO|nr:MULTISPECIES: type IX secretion system membrane protein PorP/SprF [Flavobacterium]RTY84221.1 type IX secretion system membrane protein PorP/SprF [Flavobacterium sp. LS1P28]RTY92965.1 type IX secretion system membrane protein PorP/SprF [Flavobacterium sp. RSP46]RTZ03162.1 type IX secretion system membrane protein PorP/SprF [Flavobacterium bomense]RTZ08469.1 type IX secretion system membrane protein PorP/SprF [Flavobacterium sp. GSP6]